MAHTKALGAARINRDSNPNMLGVKVYGGQPVKPGNIIIRQRGMTFAAGPGVLLSRDFTLMATTHGIVHFYKRKGKKHVKVMIQDPKTIKSKAKPATKRRIAKKISTNKAVSQ